MRRVRDIKQEGFWQKLRALIIKRNPALSDVLDQLEGLKIRSRGVRTRSTRQLSLLKKAGRRQLRVFISYASPDLGRVSRLYRKLRSEPDLDLWFDRGEFDTGRRLAARDNESNSYVGHDRNLPVSPLPGEAWVRTEGDQMGAREGRSTARRHYVNHTR